MNAELFIHGPRHAFYGKQDEASYSTLFDDSSIKDEVRFIVEIRKNTDNKWYTYYNYCRYGNVCDIDGRNGAYIGISLRLDAYYTNLRAVYTILDAIFCKAAVGLLVQKVPSGFKYMVNNFESSKSQILEKIEKPIGVLLSQILSIQEVVPIDGSFKTGGKAYLHGIDDTQFKERRLAEMRATGRIIFASSAPIEQLQAFVDQCNRDKQAFIDSKKQEISHLESSLTSASNEINALREKLSHSETECKRLSDKVSNLQQDISSFEAERKQLNSLKEKNQSLENQLRTSETNVAKLKRDLSSFETERKQLNSLKGENASLRKQLLQTQARLQQEIGRNNVPNCRQEGLPCLPPTEITTNTEPPILAPTETSDNKGISSFLAKCIEFIHRNKKLVKLIGIFTVILALVATLLICLISTFSNHSSKDKVKETTNNLPYVRDTILFSNTDDCAYINITPEGHYLVGNQIDVLIQKDKEIDGARWQIMPDNEMSIERQSSKFIRFTPNSVGECTIAYIRNDTIVLQRIITIEK